MKTLFVKGALLALLAGITFSANAKPGVIITMDRPAVLVGQQENSPMMVAVINTRRTAGVVRDTPISRARP